MSAFNADDFENVLDRAVRDGSTTQAVRDTARITVPVSAKKHKRIEAGLVFCRTVSVTASTENGKCTACGKASKS